MMEFSLSFVNGSLKGRSMWIRARNTAEAHMRAHEIAAATKATAYDLEVI